MTAAPQPATSSKQFPDWVFDGATEFQSRLRSIVSPIARRAWKFELTGFDRLPKNGAAILCPNHISFLDSALLMILSPRNISFIGKSEYMDSWKTRWFFPKVGMIPVDRSGGEKSHAALDAAERVLRRGELFGIFPEGTRSRDGMLYKGHTGAARLAIKVGCPIFPVGIVGTREIQPPDAPMPRLGGRVKIAIGRPIDVSRYVSRGADPMVLREITDELMFEIRELTGQEYRNTYATKKRTETIVAETAEIPRFSEAQIAAAEKLHA
ncbi:MAG: lysophospholipid acyltransferase family protein [Ilumatobacteraceae bacterium]